MADQIVRRWTCDRCKATAEGDGTGFQPPTWVGMFQVHPPAASCDGVTRRTLCSDCHASYLDWWNASENDGTSDE